MGAKILLILSSAAGTPGLGFINSLNIELKTSAVAEFNNLTIDCGPFTKFPNILTNNILL